MQLVVAMTGVGNKRKKRWIVGLLKHRATFAKMRCK